MWQAWANRVGVVDYETLPDAKYKPTRQYRKKSEPVPVPEVDCRRGHCEVARGATPISCACKSSPLSARSSPPASLADEFHDEPVGIDKSRDDVQRMRLAVRTREVAFQSICLPSPCAVPVSDMIAVDML